MKSCKFIAILGWVAGIFSATSTYAQVGDLDAILDSLDSETYIAREIRLQEVEIHGVKDPRQALLLRYYKNNNLSTTEDVLSKLSGMYMVRRGNYAWEPVHHGMSGPQLNVTLDGMQIFGACTDKMDPVTSYVEPNNLETINLNQGKDAFEFGSNTGGGIGLKLKKPVFNEFNASAGGRLESVSEGFGNYLSFNKGNEKLAVRANAVYRKSNDYKTGDGDRIDYSGFNKFNGSLGIGWLLSRDQMLSADVLIDNAWDIGYPALPMDVEYARAQILGLTYTRWNPMPGFSELETKVYYNQINHKMDDSHRENIPMHMDMPGNTRTTGGYVRLKNEKSCKHEYSLKIDGYFTEAHAEMTMYPDEGTPMYMLTWPDVQRGVTGLVLSDRWHSCKSTSISGSLRLDVSKTHMSSELGNRQLSVFGYKDYQDPVRFNPNFNLQVKHALSSKSYIEWGMGYSERLPSTAEQFGFYLYNAYDGFDYIGIPDLDNEKSLNASVKTELRNKKMEWGLDLSSYWFRDYILGLQNSDIAAMTIGANGVKVYENLSNALILGIDSRLIYSFSEQWNSILTMKYTYGSDRNGNALPLIPPLKINMGLRYAKGSYNFQLDAEWSTRQERINQEFGETPTQAYGLLNVKGFKEFEMGANKLQLGLGVENIFNETYQEHLDWGDIPRPGRNFVVSVDFFIP